MIETFDNCVFIPGWANFDTLPKFKRLWKTSVAPVVDGDEERRGHRNVAYRSITWRRTERLRPEVARLEASIFEGLRTGRVCAPAWGHGNPIVGGTTSYVDVRADFTAAWSHVAVWVGGVVYPRAVSGTSTPSAGVRRYTLATPLPSAPLAGDGFVWELIFGMLEVDRIEPINSDSTDTFLTLTEPPAVGSLGHSDTCVPATILTGGAGLTVCGGSVQLTLDLNTDCGLVKGVLRWPIIFGADSYKVKRSTSALGPWTLVTLLGGATHSYEVARDTVGYYYTVASVSGSAEGPSSVAVYVPPTTVEAVMRAVQERKAATADPTFGVPGTAIVWPNRTSDGASPGAYPADGFYAADTASNTLAAALVAAICTELDAAWLGFYALTNDWTGLGDTDEIPTATSALLDVPTAASVNSTNWKASLFDCAAAVCRLESLIRDVTFADLSYRTGVGLGVSFYAVTEQRTENDPSAYFTASESGWSSVVWGGTDGYVYVPSGFGGDENVSNSAVGIGGIGPGLASACGTSLLVSADYWASWYATRMSARAKVRADLSPAALGTATVFLKLRGTGSFTELPRPVLVFESLQPWTTLAPGGVADSPFLGDLMPPLPEASGEMETMPNLHHEGSTRTLTNHYARWETVDAVVQWFRSHRPADGHWLHFP